MTQIAHISLGSNLGDRRAQLDHALRSLDAHSKLRLQRVSRLYETPPIGGPEAQGAFLNAAAEIQTSVPPLELLRILQRIESESGRERVLRWAERTLDLDLLFFDDQILNLPDLILPHPRLAVRRFVLVPLAEIAPEARDPLTGLTTNDLLVRLQLRPSLFVLQLTRTPHPDPIFGRLLEETGALDAATDLIDPLTPDRWLALNLSHNPPRPPDPQILPKPENTTFARKKSSEYSELLPTHPPQIPPHPHDPTFVITDLDSQSLLEAAFWPRVPRLRVPPDAPERIVAEAVAACQAARARCEPLADSPCPDLIRPL